MDPHLDLVFSCAALGVIFGALVALPSPAALGRLETLRSPAWGIALPGALVVGTFGVLMLPSVATGLVLLASIVTPALAGIAVLAVLHRHRRRLALVSSVLVLVAMLTGWPDQVAATIVTALGCLTIGAALVRLTPSPWLGIGVLAMCGLDVLLLSTGVGQAAARLLDAAVPGSGLPALDRAGVGPISADYPDLILAAVVGGILAGRGVQRRAAALAAALSAAYAGLLMFVDMGPATVPLAAVLLVLELAPVMRRAVATTASRSRPRRPRPLTLLPAES